jgi:membrane protease YdiL (CAAX protease family)
VTVVPTIRPERPAAGWRGVLSAVAFTMMVLIAVLFAQGLWSVLLAENLARSPAVPWSVAVTAALLWVVWRYLDGGWGRSSSSAVRRLYLRAHGMPIGQFAFALLAGALALSALVALWLVVTQLLPMPQSSRPDLAAYPPFTVAVVVTMASLVGAIVEEAGLRGYMFTRLSTVLPVPAAIVAVAIVIIPGHALTQGFVAPVILWYFLADVTFGALAYLSGSILPVIVIHAAGLLLFFTVIWPTDSSRGLVTLGTATPAFWLDVVLSAVLGAISVVAFLRLRTPPIR